MADRDVYGTAGIDAPVSRADFERALRHLNLSDLELRDAVLQMGARIVALTDELTRRLDGVEPEPAPAGTPAPGATVTFEATINANVDEALTNVRVGDAGQPTRVALDERQDKYSVEVASPPCEELLHLCQARCCTLSFPLSTADLDEGVIRWDYGQPYLIRQRRSDGYCVHNDPTTHACTVHAQRPRVCRTYDCRADDRIWIDYEKRIPAPMIRGGIYANQALDEIDLVDRARKRAAARVIETNSISETYADATATIGPEPSPRKPRIPPK